MSHPQPLFGEVMADLLNTSISGLLAFQRALDATSHNITNANTPGYSRQLPDFRPVSRNSLGGNWMGSGVDVAASIAPVTVSCPIRRAARRALTAIRIPTPRRPRGSAICSATRPPA